MNKMIKQMKFNSNLKKAISSCIFSRTMFLFALVCALSASVVAQPINYNLPENWMCHPVLKSTDIARKQDLTLTVLSPDSTVVTKIAYHSPTDTMVDIFYVYPTIDTDLKNLGNTEMDDIDTINAEFVYSEQVGIFAQFGRVFAPYYRQAKLKVFVDADTSDQFKIYKCMELAYSDIDSAFSNYLANYNNGRKIILMGHSQGADHVMFLLRKKFDNNPVLQSQLVVALCAGEPNYASVDGSRTGGTLQHIKACPPKDSVPECGCMMNWRTWNKLWPVEGLANCSFFYNRYFESNGLIYQTYDSINHSHQEANYDFGYTTTPKPIARYISLNNDCKSYVGFDNMFRANVDSTNTGPGTSHLLIDTIFTPNDRRIINTFPPSLSQMLQSGIPLKLTYEKRNYHIWDWQFVQNDVLQLLPELIKITHPTTTIPEISDFGNTIRIYPNPTNGSIHLTSINQKIKSIKLYNLRGDFIEEFFKNDFSISSLTAGIYFLTIQTDKSTFVKKLVKQ
jgi:hypothetical protein